VGILSLGGGGGVLGGWVIWWWWWWLGESCCFLPTLMDEDSRRHATLNNAFIHAHTYTHTHTHFNDVRHAQGAPGGVDARARARQRELRDGGGGGGGGVWPWGLCFLTRRADFLGLLGWGAFPLPLRRLVLRVYLVGWRGGEGKAVTVVCWVFVCVCVVRRVSRRGGRRRCHGPCTHPV
jgi:hypothetical protein